ncbi:MAG: S8 family serine peptidase [Acidimicrobiia bacterium]
MAAATLAGALVPATPAGAVSGPRSSFIVELAVPPLASYGEGLSLLSTLPEAARSYQAFITDRQDGVLRRAAATSAPVTYGYRTSFPGFAARLTDAEAARLAADPAVRAVSRDGVSHPTAAPDQADKGEGPLGRDGAAFLGLPDGLWDDLGGPSEAGAGMIIGVLDTGIHPEHPSFADKPNDEDGEDNERVYLGPPYDPPADWRGTCQAGEAFAVTDCNDKLVGARYFVDGFGAENLHTDEFLSARDADGHGSHTAATAAGNYGVDPAIGGHHLGIPYISGIAPRAYVAAYKVCWTRKEAEAPEPGQPDQGSCNDSDTVAAIDAAVSDGVDVINYSVGTNTATLVGPVERAFLFAVDAGVFVANSAGNNGPEASTVGAPAATPWVTSVAASSLARKFESTVEVFPTSGDAEPISTKGPTFTAGVDRADLIDSLKVPATGVAVDQAELCMPGSLDPVSVKGRIVLCKRGINPRVEKGQVVADAGGVGMILYNAEAAQDLVADVHHLPAVQVSAEDGQAIKALLDAGTVEAEIGGARAVAGPGDVLAPFSSRGPQLPVPDIPKPDITAPGVSILAATTPTPAAAEAPKGELFQAISGTSMSSPHVAGAAALLLQRDPGRSPATVKSALMTTANPEVYREDGVTPADVFDTGSGRIDPNRAAEPGLVLDAGLADYARYLEGQDPAIVEGDIPPIAAVDLNLPAVSYGSFTGTATTSRTFTSVDDKPGTWDVTVTGLSGLTTAVSLSTLELNPGASVPVQLTLTLADAPLDTYTFGALVLTNAEDGRTVRLPVSARPVRIAAPVKAAIPTDVATGTAPVTARAGYQGEISALGWGLAPPRLRAGETVSTAPGANNLEASPGVDIFDVTVPAGAQILAADVTNADGGAATEDIDLDLFLFYDDEGDGFDAEDGLAASADPDAEESVAIPYPAPGAYRFSVVGFKTKDPVSSYDFISWVGADGSPDDPATPSSAPGLEVRGDPRPVAFGDEVALELAWSGLSADGVYLGLVTFHDTATPDPAAPKAVTLVRITKSSGPPAPGG